MKYIFLVPDGMADYPLQQLGGKTPLMAADTPFMDRVVEEGIIGRARTIPEGFNPGSDVANLSLLGYNPAEYYPGRAPLEAANMGVKIGQDEVAFRCNLIKEKGGLMSDYSAGHISNSESREIIEYLNATLGTDEVRFYAGVSYRNVLVIKSKEKEKLLKLRCIPPHDITGEDISNHMPDGEAGDILHTLILRSRDVLSKKGFKANMIWPWGQGIHKYMPSFLERYKLQGSVISAVDLIKGIGRILSMRVIEVPGATGYLDTNYKGKAEYALKGLDEADLIYIHVEAPDEASHEGKIKDKIESLERIDRIMVSLFWDALQKRRVDRVLIAADHLTPISIHTHVRDPVPFAMAGEGVSKGGERFLNEEEALKSGIFLEEGYNLMEKFLSPYQI